MFLSAGDRVLSSLRGVRALRAGARSSLYVQESSDSESASVHIVNEASQPPAKLNGLPEVNGLGHEMNGKLDDASEEEAELDMSMGAVLDGALNGYSPTHVARPLTLDQEVYRSDVLRDNVVQTDEILPEHDARSLHHHLLLLDQQVYQSFLLQF